MLNHKKHFIWIYALLTVLLLALLWVASQDMPFNEEHVSEPLAKTLSK